MARTYDVYGVGHALVDIQYRVHPEFLSKNQIDKGVMTLVDEDQQNTLIEAITDEPVASASGGSAANTMIGIARFGGQAYYACLIGHDSWGDFYQRDLEGAGVATNPANRSDGKTGQCLVFITPDADRTLNTFLGISSAIGPTQVQEDLVAASHFVYLEGYLFSSDDGFAASTQAQEMAQRHSTSVSLTLSDPFMVSTFKDRFYTLMQKGVDVLFCNEDEALAYTDASTREKAGELLSQKAGVTYITCGADGVLVYAPNLRQHVPGVQVEAVDTTGAGDLFAGGALYGLTHGYNPLDAARLGSYAAAQVVARFGPRLDTSLADQINHILSHFKN